VPSRSLSINTRPNLVAGDGTGQRTATYPLKRRTRLAAPAHDEALSTSCAMTSAAVPALRPQTIPAAAAPIKSNSSIASPTKPRLRERAQHRVRTRSWLADRCSCHQRPVTDQRACRRATRST